MSFHRKIPSFSLNGKTSDLTPDPTPSSSSSTTTAAPADERQGRSESRSRSRGRSLSPWKRKSSSSKQRERDTSAEGVRKEAGMESDREDMSPVVHPSNAFRDDDDTDSEDEGGGEDEEEEVFEEDVELEKNTEANSSKFTPLDLLTKEGAEPTMVFAGEGPNLLPTATPTNSLLETNSSKPRRTKSTKSTPLKLIADRPLFEKNRCTVVLTQGDPDKSGREGRRTRKYVVASDLSTESLYAIQWAIGTVLRDGDECLIVSVMETDTKLDSSKPDSDKKNKIVNQKDRQMNALMLSRQATTLLERTRLNVRIVCQAIHAKNARHMLLDLIDYHEPTMVVIGSRGLTQIKGMLLGSVSNYLIQKSSAPVMVTRRPLRLARTVHKKLSLLNRESRVPLSEAIIEKESHGGETGDDPEQPSEPADIHEQVEKMTVSDK